MSRHGSFKALVGLVAMTASLVTPALTQAGGPDLPAYAKPGQCYGRVTTPAIYSTTTVKELVRAGRKATRRLVRPALVQTSVSRVQVSPARTVQVRGSGTYRVVTKTVTVPGRRYWKVEQATFETVTEKVLIEAAHAEWRPTSQPLAYGESMPGQTMLQATGEVYCRVLVPARYETRSR